MKKSEIVKIDDKDLQLRYYLGGLRVTMNDSQCYYWSCDIDCSCSRIDEIDLTDIKDFIKKHNISNERFLLLAYNFLNGNFVYYHNEPSELIIELSEILKPLSFGKREKKEDNTIFDEKLEELISDAKNPHAFYVNDIRNFIKKYNLTDNDFITLAKTWISHRFWGLHIDYDRSIETFPSEIKSIINEHDLFIEKDKLDEFIEAQKRYNEDTQLILETKSQQAKYLKLMRNLLQSNPEVARELLQGELNELGFNTGKDVKRLVLSNNKK